MAVNDLKKDQGAFEQSDISCEMMLLIASARSHLEESELSLVENLLKHNIDWHQVVQGAVHHKVVPLVLRNFEKNFKNEIPQIVFNQLRSVFRKTSIYNLAITACLANVLDIFNRSNVEVLSFKGAVLANRLYGAQSMRMYSDLDIIVYEKDIRKALDILLDNGFVIHPEGMDKTIFLKFLKYYHHGRLLDKNGICVEMHWEMSGFYAPFSMTLERIKPYLTDTILSDIRVKDLTDEMLLIYLCLHGNKHCFTHLDSIVTIAEMVKNSPTMDWDKVERMVDEYKMRKRFEISLSLAKMLFGTDLPADIQKGIEGNAKVKSITEGVVYREFKETARSTIHPMRKLISYQFRAMDTKMMSLKFISRSLVIPEHELWSTPRLPRFFFFLYYMYKPFMALTMPIRKIIK